jgi:hypothetical protein
MRTVGFAQERLRNAGRTFAVFLVGACLMGGSTSSAAASVYLLMTADHLTLVDIHAVSGDAVPS